MRCFLDTSSLLKFYYPKEDSGQMINKIYQNGITKFCLSEITKIEFFSAVYKKTRQRNITEQEANNLIKRFKEEEFNFLWEKLDQKYRTTNLRTLDAIQLASAINLNSKKKSNFFVSHDNILCNLFGQEKLQPL